MGCADGDRIVDWIDVCGGGGKSGTVKGGCKIEPRPGDLQRRSIRHVQQRGGLSNTHLSQAQSKQLRWIRIVDADCI